MVCCRFDKQADKYYFLSGPKIMMDCAQTSYKITEVLEEM